MLSNYLSIYLTNASICELILKTKISIYGVLVLVIRKIKFTTNNENHIQISICLLIIFKYLPFLDLNIDRLYKYINQMYLARDRLIKKQL